MPRVAPLRSRTSAVALAGGVATALLLTGCGGDSTTATEAGATPSGTDGLSIVASTDVYGSIATAVAGDAATVTSIITDPSADPHSYEANTRTQLELSRADVVVENGGGYDDFVDTMLKAADNPDVRVVNAVDVSGKAAGAGEELNEHVWYDVPSVRKVADAVEAALTQAAPDDAATFKANADAFDAQLATLEQTITADAAATRGAPVAITEPVPGYLLDALGAVEKTPEAFSEAIEEDTDVPVDVLQETLALFTDRQVRALVYNEQTTGPQTEQVLAAARAAGIAVVPVTETLPEGKDYTTWMTENVEAVAAALRP
ncbi:zinc ABC transporter solute-binding protein [Kineococcus sp. R8]|uniref:metal ABC transporter solute-binding protein, Zn/Mn family n=1 Tax=Kineococcus siccus TaxID=2696567 RepID=UPI001412CDA8|nr:zinc ABC transporter substrate-binding protein [Kineococcus siccus]NAZ82333.1 zinc ABC transporter solute-binding protein [Kineococcus siccus]